MAFIFPRESRTQLDACKGAPHAIFNATLHCTLSALLGRISSVDEIMRILAYIFRWYANLRMPKTQRSLSALTANELLRGHDALIRIV